MRKHPLYCLTIPVTPASESPACELLERTFGVSPVVFNNLETGISQVSVYVEFGPARLLHLRRRLRLRLRTLAQAGMVQGNTRFNCRKVRSQDWSQSWKRHFRPIEVSDRLLIKPSWSRRKPRRDAHCIVLDPGLSFGTGQHPTTLFCLQKLAGLGGVRPHRSLLDMGTGTGILAIAAEKLGFRPVDAFDHDPDAIRIARANATQNGAGRIRFSCKDLTKTRRLGRARYDVICANLTSDLLIAGRSKIVRSLKRGGSLLLAGILETQFARVTEAYEKSGLTCRERATVNEWTSGVFEFDGAGRSQ